MFLHYCLSAFAPQVLKNEVSPCLENRSIDGVSYWQACIVQLQTVGINWQACSALNRLATPEHHNQSNCI